MHARTESGGHIAGGGLVGDNGLAGGLVFERQQVIKGSYLVALHWTEHHVHRLQTEITTHLLLEDIDDLTQMVRQHVSLDDI